jgi:hypothetical protein
LRKLLTFYATYAIFGTSFRKTKIYKKLSILKIRLSTDPRILTEIRWYQFLQFDITVAPPNWRVAVKRSIKIE